MNRQTVIGMVGGVLVVLALLGGGLFWTKGNHLELTGSVERFDTIATEEAASVGVAQIQITNPSDVPFVVKSVTIEVPGPDGSPMAGDPIAEVDLRRLYTAYPQLGEKKLESLRAKTEIAPHGTGKFLVGTRLEIPEALLKARKNLQVKIVDVDGASAEIREK